MARLTLDELSVVVTGYLARMGLPDASSDGYMFMFKRGSTAVVVSLFEDETAGDHTFARFTAATLSDFEPSPALIREILRLNAEVTLGAFILFEDNTLSFSATLLGDKLDFEEFEFALNYVAQVSDDYDDLLQEVAGGHRAEDLLREFE